MSEPAFIFEVEEGKEVNSPFQVVHLLRWWIGSSHQKTGIPTNRFPPFPRRSNVDRNPNENESFDLETGFEDCSVVSGDLFAMLFGSVEYWFVCTSSFLVFPLSSGMQKCSGIEFCVRF